MWTISSFGYLKGYSSFEQVADGEGMQHFSIVPHIYFSGSTTFDRVMPLSGLRHMVVTIATLMSGLEMKPEHFQKCYTNADGQNM